MSRGGGTVSQTVRPQAEGWVFESQPRQTLVVKTDSDSSTANHSTIGVSVLDDDHYKRMPRLAVGVER